MIRRYITYIYILNIHIGLSTKQRCSQEGFGSLTPLQIDVFILLIIVLLFIKKNCEKSDLI